MDTKLSARKEILRRIKKGEVSAEEGLAQLLAADAKLPASSKLANACNASEAAKAAAEPMEQGAAGQHENNEPQILDALEKRLSEIVAKEAQLPPSRISAYVSVQRYGFDSVMALNVLRKLEPDFGKLSPTLLFQFQTIAELASYLYRNHQEATCRMVGAQSPRRELSPLAAPQPLSAVQSAQSRSHRSELGEPDDGAIAVIGISCRFPLANNVREFWNNLQLGRDCIREIPVERWDYHSHFDPEKGRSGKSYSKWGGFIDDVDKFDAEFFQISPREAERMDPQERILLEEVWHALEDAALTRPGLAGQAVGVYVGIMYSQYHLLQVEEALKGNFLYLGSSYASIANRVSYFYNFRGPSMAIDSMCSSSLTAVHLACEALRRGDIRVAVTAGVNLTIHPSKHHDLSQGRFASSDGRCRAFGDGGDGYVPGEGIGVAILKSLADAKRDGDRIYGVIRSSVLNHGGHTNGYTAPSPAAHSALIAEALKRAKLNPRHVSYVEAHGTGTALGDPIEIAGLAEAFNAHTEDRQFCAIGSVKSNIGHLEGAAGIAGLLKVLLQLQQRMLAPSLHSEPPNRHIDFANTPFFVQRTLEKWQAPMVSSGAYHQQLPRIAAISSFGAGGANAHLLVEEYREQVPTPAISRPLQEHLFVISAKSEERLREYARLLGEYLASVDLEEAGEESFLVRVAHTLLRGREGLEERLALWAQNCDELVRKLSAFAMGRSGVDVLRGSAASARPHAPKPHLSQAGNPLAPSFMSSKESTDGRSKQREHLIRSWLNGEPIDFGPVIERLPARPISLPGYPFSRHRHWPELSELPQKWLGGATADLLHPLVHRNISTLYQQRFESTFLGTEPLLRDHEILGETLLPGAASLEMARAACSLSGGEGRAPLSILNTTWERPIRVRAAQKLTVSTSLVPGNGVLEYCIFSEEHAEQRTIYVRGVMSTAERSLAAAAESLNLQGLFAHFSLQLDSDEIYKRFAALGFCYGPTLRTLERLQCSESQALGWLRLPPHSTRQHASVVLLPELIDGAFQTLLAFYLDAEDDTIQVPFALDRLDILAPLPERCLVFTSAREPRARAPGRSQKFDLTLADADGRVCVRMEGLVTQPLRRRMNRPQLPSAASVKTMLFRPEWQPSEVSRSLARLKEVRCVLLFAAEEQSAEQFRRALQRHGSTAEVLLVRFGSSFEEHAGRTYVLGAGNEEHYERLFQKIGQERKPIDAIVHAWALKHADDRAAVTEELLEQSFYSLLALARVLARHPGRPGRRLVYVHPGGIEHPCPSLAAVGAFNKTVHTEDPSLCFTTFELGVAEHSPRPSAPTLNHETAELIVSELCQDANGGEEIRHRGSARQVRKLRLAQLPEPPATRNPLRQGGSYLLTGGLGGLGRIFAEYLAQRWHARLVLAGRGPLQEADKPFLERLASQAGAPAVYVQADCGRRDDVERLVKEALAVSGSLHGILHLAGTLSDGFILRKSRADAEAVLSSKIWGAAHLDAATATLPLDFFALFSSASAIMGTIGQSDYAFANAFLDHFAIWREVARKKGQRSGKTLAIGWPLWKGGGMDVTDAGKVWIEQTYGWLPLPKEEGTKLFESLLAEEPSQSVLFHGYGDKILASLRKLDGKPVTPPVVDNSGAAPPQEKIAVAASLPALRNKEEFPSYLRTLIAEELKLPLSRLEPKARFENLGLESVMIMNLTRKLEVVFGPLPKTLFFEHNTLLDLAGYFLSHFANRFESSSAGGATAADGPEAIRQPSILPTKQAAHAPWPAEHRLGEPSKEPIAIIGLSGVYPRADNLAEFWNNLLLGRDCIGEVPEDRWDHQQFYDPDPKKVGKSYGKWGGFLQRAANFDPRFFNIAPREARLMDPQERLFLQTAWHTLEDAGYTPKSLTRARVGVFIGVMYAQYQLYGAVSSMQSQGFVPSSLLAAIANRVSHFFDFHGPSIAFDTMCSSSLTALHMACLSIRCGDCEQALVGGVNLSLHPNKYLQLSQGKFAASDGRCRSFGAGGDGYVPGEGVGAVLLKPLSRALADCDHIYALVRGSSVNHGGRTNGFTVPSPTAQADVVRRAIAAAGISPRSISYVEAHGTGTALGDPIEIAGLVRAFQSEGSTQPPKTCRIGSVKSNIGHLESAAGIAGLSKVLLQLQHHMLVPSIHAEELNPNINFDATPFVVQRALEPWPPRIEAEQELPRLAAVSSFGAGGANAHVIVEEHVAAALPLEASAPQLIVLSAKTVPQLIEYAKALADHIELLCSSPAPYTPAGGGDVNELLDKLRVILAGICSVQAEDIAVDDSLDSMGLDTAAYARLSDAVQRELGIACLPSDFSASRTIKSAVLGLSVRLRAATGASPPALTGDRAARPRLRDIAFTLQQGRIPLEERLAVVASNVESLIDRLRDFAKSEGRGPGVREPSGIFHGRANAAVLDELVDGEEGQAYLQLLMRGNKLEKLAKLFVAGLDFDWAPLHKGRPVQRLALPGYPFLAERYWVPEAAEKSASAPMSAVVPEVKMPPATREQRSSGGAPLTGERREEIKNAVLASVAEVLEIASSELDLDLPHSDFGVDSVMAVAIIERINLALGSALKPTDLFNYTSIRKLVEHLATSLPAGNAAGPAGRDGAPDLRTEGRTSQTLRQFLALLETGELTAEEAEHLLDRLPAS